MKLAQGPFRLRPIQGRQAQHIHRVYISIVINQQFYGFCLSEKNRNGQGRHPVISLGVHIGSFPDQQLYRLGVAVHCRPNQGRIRQHFATDGIELHSPNGYLLNQFIDSQSNTRTDEYGGSVQNRIRFLKEVVQAVSEEIGADKVGVRLAPLTTLNGTVDDNPEETYLAIASMLNSFKIGYMHIAEADWDDAPQMPISFKMAIREAYSGLLIYAGKYDTERAEQALTEGWADMIGFGRPFVANPDLPYRLANNVPLNEHNPDTLFGGGEKGYTDYSFAK